MEKGRSEMGRGIGSIEGCRPGQPIKPDRKAEKPSSDSPKEKGGGQKKKLPLGPESD